MHSFHRLLASILVGVALGLLIVASPAAAADAVGQLVEVPSELAHELWNTRQSPHVVVPLTLEQGAMVTDVAVT